MTLSQNVFFSSRYLLNFKNVLFNHFSLTIFKPNQASRNLSRIKKILKLRIYFLLSAVKD